METLTKVAYVVSPVITYLPQFYEKGEGFSSTTCLILLILSVFRVAFWVCRRVREWSYLVYSITLPLMQFILLDRVKGRRPREKVVKALLRGERPQSFWAWNELPPYVEVVVVVALGVAAVSAAGVHFFRDAYSLFLASAVALIDAVVGVPQLRKNWLRRDARGVSKIMVLAWLARDFILLFRYELKFDKSWQGLAVFRLVVDAVVFAQIAFYSADSSLRKLRWRRPHFKTDTELVPFMQNLEDPPAVKEPEKSAPAPAPVVSPAASPSNNNNNNGRRPIL